MSTPTNDGVIDRHKVPRDRAVWAMIDGEPKAIWFSYLLAYNGFAYSEERGGEEKDTYSEAIFASERKSLFDALIAKQARIITKAEQEIERLRELESLAARNQTTK